MTPQLPNAETNSADLDTIARGFFAVCWAMARNCANEPATIVVARDALDVLLVYLAGTCADDLGLEAALLALEAELADMRAALADNAVADGALEGLRDRVAQARRAMGSPSASVH